MGPLKQESETGNPPARGVVRILGLRFLNGSAQDAVDRVSQNGGVLTVPAAPAMVRLRDDPIYRKAMLGADYTIPDSGLMVLTWRVITGQRVPRVSGLIYLCELISRPDFRETGSAFFVLPSPVSRERLLVWAKKNQIPLAEADCYIAPYYPLDVRDEELLGILEQRKPRHVVIAIGNGPQEKLGVYLRDHLSVRPAIHCIGAAIGFLTGDQVAIPDWADRLYLGWLLRLFSQPRIFIPRLTRAAMLPWMIACWRSELPPLRASAR